MTARERLEAARARVNANQAAREAAIEAERQEITRKLSAMSSKDTIRAAVQETVHGIKNRVSLQDALSLL